MHTTGKCFVNGYGDYFGMETDMDACVYLMLANDLIHTVRPGAITVGTNSQKSLFTCLYAVNLPGR